MQSACHASNEDGEAIYVFKPIEITSLMNNFHWTDQILSLLKNDVSAGLNS